AITSACSSNGGSGGNAANGAAGSPEGTASPSAQPSAAPVDPNAKYDPPIELTTVRYTDSSFKFNGGDSIDDNVWYRAYESE
ncbi:hypothetical protein MXD81_26310, partial [Microbacteriaceae bacterium K1510]|nr:hypothetical protein [Microbacteriaceae bacterium K1510]